MRHIPNILSVLRIMMIGVFVHFFFLGQYMTSLGIYVLAMFTDLLDGYLARKNNWITSIGKVLDPLADKLMLIAALSCFCVQGWIPLWLVTVVALKELILIIGGLLLYQKDVVVYADWYGKCATIFFNAGVIATMCKRFWPWIGMYNFALLSIAIVLAIVALIHYARKNFFGREVD